MTISVPSIETHLTLVILYDQPTRHSVIPKASFLDISQTLVVIFSDPLYLSLRVSSTNELLDSKICASWSNSFDKKLSSINENFCLHKIYQEVPLFVNIRLNPI